MIEKTCLAALVALPFAMLGFLALQPVAPPAPLAPVAANSTPAAVAPAMAPQASHQFFGPVAAAPRAPATAAPAPLLPPVKKIRPLGYGLARAEAGNLPLAGRAGDGVAARPGDIVGKRAGDL